MFHGRVRQIFASRVSLAHMVSRICSILSNARICSLRSTVVRDRAGLAVLVHACHCKLGMKSYTVYASEMLTTAYYQVQVHWVQAIVDPIYGCQLGSDIPGTLDTAYAISSSSRSVRMLICP